MEFEGAFFDTSDFEFTNKKIGEGQFGKVFIVVRNEDETEYAAKIITNEGVLSGQGQVLLLREISILHKLKHPAIVQFYGINLHSFDNPDKLEPTIITEYLPRGSLKEILLKEQRSIADLNWSPTKKYICILGIADAMRYLHEKGILHRDLKPENILIDENYYPRVCDFGLSKCFSKSLTKSIQLSMTGKIGTPIYMAPELMEEDDHFGPGVDVYSFAMMAYEIITGKEPFFEKGKSIKLSNLIQKVMAGNRPSFTDGVTGKMEELITQCWSQKPIERPSFDEIFKKLSSDFTYFDEDVDEDEIKDYIEKLNEEKELVSNSDKELEIKKFEKKIKKEKRKNKKLKKEKDKAYESVEKMKKENDQLKTENVSFKETIEKITNENSELKKKIESLSNNFEKISHEKDQLKIENESFKGTIEKMKSEKVTSENNQLIHEKEALDSSHEKVTPQIVRSTTITTKTTKTTSPGGSTITETTSTKIYYNNDHDPDSDLDSDTSSYTDSDSDDDDSDDD